jgi:excisionase family DNA binding protein
MAAVAILTDEQLQALLEKAAEKGAERALARGGPAVLSTAQAAEFARVTPKTILEWINEGVDGRKLEAGHRGRKRTIRREELERFLEGRRSAPAPGSPQALAAGLRRAS